MAKNRATMNTAVGLHFKLNQGGGGVVGGKHKISLRAKWRTKED
jgi:hypothetical protein